MLSTPNTPVHLVDIAALKHDIDEYIDPFDDTTEMVECGIENPDECEACG